MMAYQISAAPRPRVGGEAPLLGGRAGGCSAKAEHMEAPKC